MYKQPLIEIVQSILSSMDSDPVNSISDTVEGLQVADIVKDSYFEIIQHYDFEQHKGLTQLNSGTLDFPTHMKLPRNVKEIIWVEHDNRKGIDDDPLYERIHYLYPDEFFYHLKHRNPSNSDVRVIDDPSGVSLNIITDEAPTYWTSFDDTYIVFDSLDEEVTTTLQNSRSVVYAVMSPEWKHRNDFIPDLPAEAFSLLIEEARSTCFAQIKQAPDEKAEQKATRQRRLMSQKNFRSNGGVRRPDYGRKGPYVRKQDPTFRRNR